MGDKRLSMVLVAFGCAPKSAAQGTCTFTQQRYSVGGHGSIDAVDNI